MWENVCRPLSPVLAKSAHLGCVCFIPLLWSQDMIMPASPLSLELASCVSHANTKSKHCQPK